MAVEVATAYVTLLPSARGFQSAMEKELSGIGGIGGKRLSGDMADEVEKASSKSGRLGKALGGIGGLIAGGFVGGAAAGAITDVIGGFISEAEDAQKVAQETANVIKSTGGAAGVTAKQVDDLATALSAKAGVDDEVIASGENVLLTFKGVANQVGEGNNVFDQATGLALDMSAAMGTDLQGAVVQVGKALNDPIGSLGALTRVGVQFTDQQKEQIKTLVESGDSLGAQKIILGELNTEFGGAAEAGATASDKLGVAWGNVQEELGTKLMPVFEKVSGWLVDVLPGAVQWMEDSMASIRAFFEEHRTQFEAIGKAIGLLFDWIKIQVRVFVEAVKIEFRAIDWIVTFANNNVVQPIIGIVQRLVDFFAPIVRTMVAAVRIEWNVLREIVSFLNSTVVGPIISIVSALATTIAQLFTVAVFGVRLAWGGIVAVYSFFIDNVYKPVSDAVRTLGNFIIQTFAGVVSGVQTVWNGIKAVVGAPINVAIGFYNNGIKRIWDAVAGWVGLGNLPNIPPVQFATGGTVPGIGNRDTVRAMLTPGEFVIQKAAAQEWPDELLAFMNDPRNAKGQTVDPGIFGYAGGGPVYRSGDDVLNFARQQVGKPYSYSAGGSGNADCSYLWSVLVNYALGATNPYTRRFSTGTIQGDRALAPGLSDLATGMNMGVRPPYQTNKAGQFVGHMAGTLMGVNFESTPPATRMSPAARGATDGFPVHYYLPGFGGPNAVEQAGADQMVALHSAQMAGQPGPWGDLFTRLINQIPGKLFDFLMTKLPGVIVDAVTSAVGAVVGAVGSAASAVGGFLNPFEGGGRITRDGPILVGEKRPEIVWGSQGEYVQDRLAVGSGGGPLNVFKGPIYGDAALERLILETTAKRDWKERAAVGAGRR